MLWRANDHARHLAVRTGTAEPVLERHIMIAPRASSSLGSVSVAMRAGTPTFDPSHTAEAATPAMTRTAIRSMALAIKVPPFHHGILRGRRITHAPHQPGQVDPKRPAKPQSP
jgi:hypothetical protein